MLKDILQADYTWLSKPLERFGRQYLSTDARAGVPHALLITGAPGVGKLALAARLASSVLCSQRGADGRACGRCKSCLVLKGGGHPDMVLLEHAEDSEQIKVDQVRGLIHTLNLSAGLGGYRVALIKDAERMNTNAANALLKTLEEPGARTLLLLCTSHPGRLPATIRSRCQQQHVPLPDTDAARDYLRAASSGAADDDINLALRLAGNAPLRAAELLESGELTVIREVYTQLNGLAGGQYSISAIAADWQEHEPRACWQWILFWLHQGASGQTEWPLFANISARRQQDLYRAALSGWQRAASGLRHDLQFQEWLLQWQAVVARVQRQAGRQ